MCLVNWRGKSVKIGGYENSIYKLVFSMLRFFVNEINLRGILLLFFI